MIPWGAPRSSRLLWRAWSLLEGPEIALEMFLLPYVDPLSRFEEGRTLSGLNRVYEWWFWDGPGGWVIRHMRRSEYRWLRVRNARRDGARGRRLYERAIRATPGLSFYWPGDDTAPGDTTPVVR